MFFLNGLILPSFTRFSLPCYLEGVHGLTNSYLTVIHMHYENSIHMQHVSLHRKVLFHKKKCLPNLSL